MATRSSRIFTGDPHCFAPRSSFRGPDPSAPPSGTCRTNGVGSGRTWATRAHVRGPWRSGATPRVVHARRRLDRGVIQARHNERPRLRFSRISIARCADHVRYSASAWGSLVPVIPPHYESARHRPRSPAHGTFAAAPASRWPGAVGGTECGEVTGSASSDVARAGGAKGVGLQGVHFAARARHGSRWPLHLDSN
jgi:hypothetical protein